MWEGALPQVWKVLLQETMAISRHAQMFGSLLLGFGIGMVLLSPRQFKPSVTGQERSIGMAMETGIGRSLVGYPGSAGRFPRTGPAWLGGRKPRGSTVAQAAKVVGTVKINVQAGKANPSPPIGPILGARGLNIMAFCKDYNALTKDKKGIVPVEITYMEDKSFTLALKTPPTSRLICKAAGIEKGAATPQIPIAKITWDQAREIAETKLPDLNCRDINKAMMQIKGTCRGMGVRIEGGTPPELDKDDY